MDKTKTSREEAERRPRQEKQPRGGVKTRPAEEAKGRPARRQPPEERAVKAPRQEGAKAPRQEAAKAKSPEKTRPPRKEEAPGKQRKAAPQEKRAAPAARQTSAGEKKAPWKQGTEEYRRRQAEPNRRRPAGEDPEDVPNRKRAYGRSKPKKPSAAATVGNAVRKAAKDNAERRKARQEKAGKKRRTPQITPAVIYTQPQAFNRSRLVVQLVTVLAVVLALVLGLSVFFKVGVITVTGEDVYDDWTVREASGIQEGDSLLTFSRARAGAQIIANLPYVKNVRFGIKLPDTVNIIIEEEDVAYAIQDQNAQWWLMNSEGRVISQIKEGSASNYTQILGVMLKDPANGQRAEAAETVQIPDDPLSTEGTAATEATEATESTEDDSPIGVSADQRLLTALQIVRELEANDIVGSAASVDVSYIENIVLWYGSRYQVLLGTASRMDYKIASMKAAIAKLSDYQSGILDVSFNIWTTQVGYTPFA